MSWFICAGCTALHWHPIWGEVQLHTQFSNDSIYRIHRDKRLINILNSYSIIKYKVLRIKSYTHPSPLSLQIPAIDSTPWSPPRSIRRSLACGFCHWRVSTHLISLVLQEICRQAIVAIRGINQCWYLSISKPVNDFSSRESFFLGELPAWQELAQ